MTEGPRLAVLTGRDVVSLTGDDALAWLDTLVTNDLSALGDGRAVFSGLLSPQGKLLCEFFVVPHESGVLLDVTPGCAGGLIKRLSLYKLRAKVTLADVGVAWRVVWAARHAGHVHAPAFDTAIVYPDPRAPQHLWRGLVPMAAAQALSVDDPAYLAARVAHGVAEAPVDYALGDTFPHEANFDLCNGVSFTKGCFIGQEVVARMQNKTVVRKRVVRVSAAAPLTSGAEVCVGAAVIGRVGSVAGHAGLALLRLDRVAEALDKGEAIHAGEQAIDVDAAAVAAYRHAAANRPVIDL